MNSSAFIPLYFTNPIAAKGAAPKIHSHESVSIPKYGLKTKYNNTATKQAAIENINCLKDSPKYTLSV